MWARKFKQNKFSQMECKEIRGVLSETLYAILCSIRESRLYKERFCRYAIFT